MMSKPKVIVTRRWPKPVEEALCDLYDTELNLDDTPLSLAQLQDAMARADAVLPTVSDKVSAEVFAGGELRARILGNFGVGFNHIDLDAAKANGIVVTNTPAVLTDCTADIAMILLLMVARRAGEGERQLRAGEWPGWSPTHLLSTKVTGKTLGIIGMGRIGKAVAKRAHHGFDMKVVFHDFFKLDPAEAAALGATQLDSVDEVLAQSDFVSLHCPGGPETFNLINAERLAMMKPSAFVINTARGDVVDDDALIDALRRGVIAGAGLDVYKGEPKLRSEYTELENVALLPHLGSNSMETRIAMGMRVVDNLKAFFAGDAPTDRVA
jgi:lactate dehydrogenase-like 2-hydroxyacid dehydrogenase